MGFVHSGGAFQTPTHYLGRYTCEGDVQVIMITKLKFNYEQEIPDYTYLS